MEFDYFYGPEDTEQYQFYRIPKLLITSEQFKDISVEAKLLYGLMLDQLSLSIKNGWFDSLNRAYIIYTIEDVMEDMHCRGQSERRHSQDNYGGEPGYRTSPGRKESLASGY